MSTPVTTSVEPTVTPLDLQVTGMTCASCAARIEKKLNKVPGVVATVNYATETAHVEAPAGVSLEQLVAVVEATGYGVREPEQEVDDDPDELGGRWRVSAVLTVPVLLVSMVPALQFAGWQWLAFLLASIVVLWGGKPFHRAAWTNARHRRDDHGHARVDRRAGGVPLVGVRGAVHHAPASSA